MQHVVQVDSNERHEGTCVYYHKYRGYGRHVCTRPIREIPVDRVSAPLPRFLEPSHVGTIPTNKVFVHWKQLTSDDRFPFLVKGLQAASLFSKYLTEVHCVFWV